MGVEGIGFVASVYVSVSNMKAGKEHEWRDAHTIRSISVTGTLLPISSSYPRPTSRSMSISMSMSAIFGRCLDVVKGNGDYIGRRRRSTMRREAGAKVDAC